MLSLICIYLTHLTECVVSVWFVKYLRLGLGTVFLSEIELKKCFWHVLFHLSAWCSYQTFFSTVTRLGLCSHRQLIPFTGPFPLLSDSGCPSPCTSWAGDTLSSWHSWGFVCESCLWNCCSLRVLLGTTYIQHSFRSHTYQVYIYINKYIYNFYGKHLQHSFRSHTYQVYIYINKYIYHFYGKHIHTAQRQKPHLSSIYIYIYIDKQVYISFLWEIPTYSTASEATLIMYIYINRYIYHFYGKYLHIAQLQKPHLSCIYI